MPKAKRRTPPDAPYRGILLHPETIDEIVDAIADVFIPALLDRLEPYLERLPKRIGRPPKKRIRDETKKNS